MGNHNTIEAKEVTEVSEQDVQQFFASAPHPQDDSRAPPPDLERRSTTATGDGIPSLPPLERLGLNSTNSLVADQPSRILSDEENQSLNEKIDRLIAAIGDGRQLDFAQDPETGNVDISTTGQDHEMDAGSLEAHIAAHPENFGNTLRPGNGRRMMRSEDSVVTSSDSIATSGTNAWERGIAAADIRYALNAIEYGAETRYGTVIRRNAESAEDIARRSHGHNVAFMGKEGLEACAISPIPLDFNKRRGTKTPSIRSNGSELDYSSPLFEKSAQAWLREPHSGSSGPVSEGDSSQKFQLKESVSLWLESVDPPSRVAIPQYGDKPERAFDVFDDDDPSRGLVSKKIPRDNPAAKALKDISNLRRAGYLAHNSFIDPKLPMAGQERPLPSRSPATAFGGAIDRDSRRRFIESKWPGLLSHGKSSRVARKYKASKGPDDRKSESQEAAATRDDTLVAHKPLHQDPVRAAHFELALARLEGRALPGQYSPIKRYADKEADYGSSVEVEHRPWRILEPKPARPFPKVSKQVVAGGSQRVEPRTDGNELAEWERTVGLDRSKRKHQASGG